MKTNIKMKVTPEQSEAVQLICFSNKVYWVNTGSNFEENNVRYIFIDIDAMALTYDSTFFHEHKFEEINPDLFIQTNGTCVEPTETLTEECQFAKYGFEKPDFECELLKEVKGKILGIVYNAEGDDTGIIAYWWDVDTGRLSSNYINKYDLTPIKKHWYETCKFPCIIMEDHCMPVVVNQYKDGYVYDFRDNKYCVNSWRLLTNDEIEGLKQ